MWGDPLVAFSIGRAMPCLLIHLSHWEASPPQPWFRWEQQALSDCHESFRELLSRLLRPEVLPSPGSFMHPRPGEFLKDSHPVAAPLIPAEIRNPVEIMKYQVSAPEYERCVEAAACEPVDKPGAWRPAGHGGQSYRRRGLRRVVFTCDGTILATSRTRNGHTPPPNVSPPILKAGKRPRQSGGALACPVPDRVGARPQTRSNPKNPRFVRRRTQRVSPTRRETSGNGRRLATSTLSCERWNKHRERDRQLRGERRGRIPPHLHVEFHSGREKRRSARWGPHRTIWDSVSCAISRASQGRSCNASEFPDHDSGRSPQYTRLAVNICPSPQSPKRTHRPRNDVRIEK